MTQFSQATTQTFGINDLLRRQTPDSKYSHFAGTLEELVDLVAANFDRATPSMRKGKPVDGIMLVPVPVDGFFSGVVELTADTQLRASFAVRRKGELPYLHVEAIGAPKLPAKFVEVVVYRRDVLAGDASTEADWELVSLNARPVEGEEPLTPQAMARNTMARLNPDSPEAVGGTAASYSEEEWMRAVLHWNRHVQAGQ